MTTAASRQIVLEPATWPTAIHYVIHLEAMSSPFIIRFWTLLLSMFCFFHHDSCFSVINQWKNLFDPSCYSYFLLLSRHYFPCQLFYYYYWPWYWLICYWGFHPLASPSTVCFNTQGTMISSSEIPLYWIWRYRCRSIRVHSRGSRWTWFFGSRQLSVAIFNWEILGWWCISVYLSPL